MMRLRVLIAALAVASVAVLPSQAPAQGSGKGLAVHLGQSLQAVNAAMAALDPTLLHVPEREKTALADGQASIARNLSQAVPGLMSAFSSEPGNLGAAFRLYQDAEAVLAVAQRSSDVLPSKDDDHGGADLRSSAATLRSDLDALGNWIETQGDADYAARKHAASAPAAAASSVPAPPPATLVIGDANTTPAKKPAPAKKKAVPKIPHS